MPVAGSRRNDASRRSRGARQYQNNGQKCDVTCADDGAYVIRCNGVNIPRLGSLFTIPFPPHVFPSLLRVIVITVLFCRIITEYDVHCQFDIFSVSQYHCVRDMRRVSAYSCVTVDYFEGTTMLLQSSRDIVTGICANTSHLVKKFDWKWTRSKCWAVIRRSRTFGDRNSRTFQVSEVRIVTSALRARAEI